MAVLEILFAACALTIFQGIDCTSCDLSSAETCFGGAVELVPRIYWNPLDIELLYDISQNFCDKSLDNCVLPTEGNCSMNTVAPYLTVVYTTKFLCERDLSQYSSCVGNADFQEAVSFCFQSFKNDYDVTMRNSELSTTDVKAYVCRSYGRLFSCAGDMAKIMCDVRSRLFVSQLLHTATKANMRVLDCD